MMMLEQAKMSEWVRAVGALLGAAAIFSMAPGAANAQSASKAAPDAWANVLAAAKSEGKVVLYHGGVPSIIARVKADFENAYPGIVLEHSRVAGNVIANTLEEERKSGRDGADVTIVTELQWLNERIKEGQIAAPIGPEMGSWPAKYMMSKTAPVLAVEPYLIAYNTNAVKTPITGYRDLLRPELKGKVGTSEPIATILAAFYDWLGKTQGGDYMEKLAAQQPRLYTGTIPGSQATASGEISAVIFTIPSVIVPLINAGAPVKAVEVKPSFGVSFAGGILAWSKRKNASQVFLNYLMSARGQSAWAGKGESASPLKGIPGSLDASAINPYDPSKYPPDFLKTYEVKWRQLFKK